MGRLFSHADPNAANLDVSGSALLSAAIALLKCSSGRIGMAPTACSRGLAESRMRVKVPPPSTPDRGHEEKPLFNESKRWLNAGPEPLMNRRRVSDRSQGSHAPG